VARETRGKRRAQKRAARGEESKTVPQKPAVQRARARQAQQRPGMQPASTQTGRREPRERGKFVKEAIAELRKVEWPNRAQVIQGTIVVIIACVIVGAFLYGADQALKPFVRTVLLGQ
jgi:preprotein translocase subunit SecE